LGHNVRKGVSYDVPKVASRIPWGKSAILENGGKLQSKTGVSQISPEPEVVSKKFKEQKYSSCHLLKER